MGMATLLLLGGCGQSKTSILAECRNEAVKALPVAAEQYYSQPFDDFVRYCATSKGLHLDAFRRDCLHNTPNVELEEACYRWQMEPQASRHGQ
jgi:hypothetical protein